MAPPRPVFRKLRRLMSEGLASVCSGIRCVVMMDSYSFSGGLFEVGGREVGCLSGNVQNRDVLLKPTGTYLRRVPERHPTSRPAPNPKAGASGASANKQLINHPMGRRSMRRIDKLAAVELLLGKNRPMMGEGQKPFFTVVMAHTGITDTPKRQIILRHMH